MVAAARMSHKADSEGRSAHPDQTAVWFLKEGIWNIGCVGRSERNPEIVIHMDTCPSTAEKDLGLIPA